jgi:hypothetical protein
MVNDCAGQYAEARTKLDNSVIINAVINCMRELSPKGGFLKYDPAHWCYYKISDSDAVSVWLHLVSHLVESVTITSLTLVAK